MLGALLAPPLFWAARSLKPAAEAKGWLKYEVEKKGENKGEREAKGWCAFLDSDFSKVSNRAIILAALLLLWPLLRSLKIRSLHELGLEPNSHRWRDFAVGWVVSVAAMAVLGAILLKLGVYRMKDEPPWASLLAIAGSGLVIAFLEEWVFRGAILGTFRRQLGDYTGLFCVSALFSILHFLNSPATAIAPENVNWLSGFTIMPERFEKFQEPMQLLGGFSTLFLFGWVCGWAVIRTRGLALAMGFHAGMVLGKFGFNRLTKRPKDMRDLLPWLGEDMTVGLVGVGIVALVGVSLFVYARFFRRSPGTP